MNLFLNFLLLITVHNCKTELFKHYPEVDVQYKFHTTPLTWNEARIKCREENSTLAMPRNQAENDVIQKILESYPGTMLNKANKDLVFVGFHDMFQEGEYITENGKTLQYAFRKWYSSDPNGGNTENCGALVRNGGLADYSCTNKAYFFCQKSGQKNVQDNNDCPTGDRAYKKAPTTEKCYKLHVDPRPWAEARAICAAEGGYLAIINSEEEEKYILSLINRPENIVDHVTHKCCVYLGFHDIFQEGNFVTVFGDNIYDVGYVKWSKGNPSNSNGNENCGSLDKNGGLNDYPCASPAPFLCEMETNGHPAIDIRFNIEKK